MTLDLTGKTALVCGASRGIGRASAQALAAAGCRIVLLSRDPDSLETVRASLPGSMHQCVVADLCDRDALRPLIGAQLEHGPIHILLNNSGGPAPGPLSTAPESALQRTFEQHVLAAHALAGWLLPGMRAARYGRIINVISTSVKEPLKGLGVSNTIRGAMAAWAKTLAGEVAADGITVNNVLPGFTQTDRLSEIIANKSAATGKDPAQVEADMRAQVPAGRFADPAETAAAIAFLASPAAAYINGINVPVDGGRTLSL